MRTPSSLASPPTQRRARRSRWFAAFAFNAALKLDHPNSIVQCLLIPHQTLVPKSTTKFNRRSFVPFLKVSARQFHHSDHTSSPTALHLWGGFDKFLHPYGVSNNNHDENNELNYESSGAGELLNALLPRLPTKEEKSRILEGFQRARLDEQLRLYKRSRRSGVVGDNIDDIDENLIILADDGGGVSRMTDLFQRARLAEQLRLSKRTEGYDSLPRHEQNGGVQPFKQNSNAGKDEAFQRALLGERLKIRQLQRQRLISSDLIEKAMMEYENETEEEHKSLQTITMVQEKEDYDNADDLGEESEHENDAIVVSIPSASGGNGKAISVGGKQLPVNQTEDAPSKQLSDKLEALHQMVIIATKSPSSTTRSPALSTASTTTNNTTFSLQNFLSTTHLPLPPREDASLFSLALAPMAYLLSCMFLLGAAAFYAVIAIIDVIWNDNKDEYGTCACLKEASSLWRSSWKYVFPASGEQVNGSAVQRTMRALQTSIIATFYACESILVRAAKYSKYAIGCMDAGTGALRYLVYTVRSTHVLWTRVVDSLIRYFQNKRQIDQNRSPASIEKKRNNLQLWKQKLNPLRILSSNKSTGAQQSNQQSSLPVERQPLHSDEMYNKKLHLLNLDRVTLERDRQELHEAQRQLESERRQLLSEGVNLLAWYSAAREAAAATEEVGNEEGQKQEKKRNWGLWWWRGREKQ